MYLTVSNIKVRLYFSRYRIKKKVFFLHLDKPLTEDPECGLEPGDGPILNNVDELLHDYVWLALAVIDGEAELEARPELGAVVHILHRQPGHCNHGFPHISTDIGVAASPTASSGALYRRPEIGNIPGKFILNFFDRLPPASNNFELIHS